MRPCQKRCASDGTIAGCGASIARPRPFCSRHTGACGTWSRLNRQRVETLLASGLTTDAGMRAIEAARLDGSWSMLDAVDALEIPEDLAQALAAEPHARRNFDAFAPSARKLALTGFSALDDQPPARSAFRKRPDARLRT